MSFREVEIACTKQANWALANCVWPPKLALPQWEFRKWSCLIEHLSSPNIGPLTVLTSGRSKWLSTELLEASYFDIFSKSTLDGGDSTEEILDQTVKKYPTVG